MNTILTIGLLSGCIQLLGYFYYIFKTHKNDISPNPTTWLIFAFDTSLLVFLEFVAGASFALLLLPFTCSLGAIYVAWLVRKAGRLSWPDDKIDSYILKVGLIIAISYTFVFALHHLDIVPTSTLFYLGILFLILSNVNTIIAFVPITREVKTNPEKEHAGPWTIWTVAYGLLCVATYLEVGLETQHLALYLYPVSCLLLHGMIAWLARDQRKSYILRP